MCFMLYNNAYFVVTEVYQLLNCLFVMMDSGG